MPEVKQYTLTHKELLELLIKLNNVHEGRWSLLVGMSISTGMFGPAPNQTFPGAAVTFSQIGMQRENSGTTNAPQPPGTIILDAAVVNPPKNASKAPKAKRKR